MSDPELRDPRLDEAYRQTPGDEPPPELDERIRAAARRAVGARPQPLDRRSWTARWRVPLSLAASVAVVVTLALMVHEEEQRVFQRESAPAPSAPAPMADRPAARADGAAKPAEPAPARRPEPVVPGRVAPAPAAPPPQLQKLEQRQQRIEEPATGVAPPPAAAPAAPPVAAPGGIAPSLSRERAAGERPERELRSAPAAARSAPPRSPEEWLAEIRRLKAQGRDADAAAELAEFRRRHPDYALPADLAR
jgi:hypothetical protein